MVQISVDGEIDTDGAAAGKRGSAVAGGSRRTPTFRTHNLKKLHGLRERGVEDVRISEDPGSEGNGKIELARSRIATTIDTEAACDLTR